jgi:hypothetical protein
MRADPAPSAAISPRRGRRFWLGRRLSAQGLNSAVRKIDGDYFSILGLPLLPLLMRSARGAIDG